MYCISVKLKIPTRCFKVTKSNNLENSSHFANKLVTLWSTKILHQPPKAKDSRSTQKAFQWAVEEFCSSGGRHSSRGFYCGKILPGFKTVSFIRVFHFQTDSDKHTDTERETDTGKHKDTDTEIDTDTDTDSADPFSSIPQQRKYSLSLRGYFLMFILSQGYIFYHLEDIF